MRELPTGTVTFLFTDIEESTALGARSRGNGGSRRAPPGAAAHGHRGSWGCCSRSGMLSRPPFPPLPTPSWLPHGSTNLAGRALARPSRTLRVRMALHAGEATPDARGDYSPRRSTGWPACWRGRHPDPADGSGRATGRRCPAGRRAPSTGHPPPAGPARARRGLSSGRTRAADQFPALLSRPGIRPTSPPRRPPSSVVPRKA